MTKARAPTARRASPLGFWAAMAAALVLYVINIFELISGRDAIHVILSAIAVALIRCGRLERRALKDSWYEAIPEKAEYLSKRRARMLPFLAVIFLSQQAAFFSSMNSPAPHSAYTVKISRLAGACRSFFSRRSPPRASGSSPKPCATSSMTRTPAPTAMTPCAGGSCSRWAPQSRSTSMTMFDNVISARECGSHRHDHRHPRGPRSAGAMLERRAHRDA